MNLVYSRRFINNLEAKFKTPRYCGKSEALGLAETEFKTLRYFEKKKQKNLKYYGMVAQPI